MQYMNPYTWQSFLLHAEQKHQNPSLNVMLDLGNQPQKNPKSLGFTLKHNSTPSGFAFNFDLLLSLSIVHQIMWHAVKTGISSHILSDMLFLNLTHLSPHCSLSSSILIVTVLHPRFIFFVLCDALTPHSVRKIYWTQRITRAGRGNSICRFHPEVTIYLQVKVGSPEKIQWGLKACDQNRNDDRMGGLCPQVIQEHGWLSNMPQANFWMYLAS